MGDRAFSADQMSGGNPSATPPANRPSPRRALVAAGPQTSGDIHTQRLAQPGRQARRRRSMNASVSVMKVRYPPASKVWSVILSG